MMSGGSHSPRNPASCKLPITSVLSQNTVLESYYRFPLAVPQYRENLSERARHRVNIEFIPRKRFKRIHDRPFIYIYIGREISSADRVRAITDVARTVGVYRSLTFASASGLSPDGCVCAARVVSSAIRVTKF